MKKEYNYNEENTMKKEYNYNEENTMKARLKAK